MHAYRWRNEKSAYINWLVKISRYYKLANQNCRLLAREATDRTVHIIGFTHKCDDGNGEGDAGNITRSKCMYPAVAQTD